jgi:hypothetical protein
MRRGSQRAFCQSRRLPSKDNTMLLMPTMEDSSLRRIHDCRLSICEVPPIVAAHECAIQGPKRGGDPKKC